MGKASPRNVIVCMCKINPLVYIVKAVCHWKGKRMEE